MAISAFLDACLHIRPEGIEKHFFCSTRRLSRFGSVVVRLPVFGNQSSQRAELKTDQCTLFMAQTPH
jgi:hypothetical protein